GQDSMANRWKGGGRLVWAAAGFCSVLAAAGLGWRAARPGLSAASGEHSPALEPLQNQRPTEERPSLAEADRQFLWETENVAFQLTYKFAPQLGATLRRADTAGLTAYFAANFEGRVFASGPADTL